MSSNDEQSLVVWESASGDWTDMTSVGTTSYPAKLGPATNGTWIKAGSPSSVVVGHQSGLVSIWSYDFTTHALELLRTVDVRNPKPVNPWNLHSAYGVAVAYDDASLAVVVVGSDDGYISFVEVPSGTILSQTVYNQDAQRGINNISIAGDALLVASCSVGSSDRNLWCYGIDSTSWTVSLLDSVNLVVDSSQPQIFNFDATWAAYSGGICWFASTEEGALWMGTLTDEAKLDVFGYLAVGRTLGSTLAYTDSPGRLAVVAYDLYEFATGSS